MVAANFQTKGTVVVGSSAATVSPGYPSGLQANDIIIAEIYLESTATVTPPSGFALFETVTNASVGFRVNRFWKRATGSETGTGTFTWTGATWRDGYMWSVRGAATSGTPFEILGQAHQNDLVASTTPNYSASTTGADRFVCLSVHDYWGAYFTPASGWVRSAFEGSATSIYTRSYATATSFGPISMAADTASTDELNRAKSVSAIAFIPADSAPAVERENVQGTLVGVGSWAAAQGSPVAPAYPAGIQQDDLVFCVVHNKTSGTGSPSEVAIPTMASPWQQLGTWWNTTDSQANGADTGRTRCTIFYRSAPSGGLSGTENVSQSLTGTTTSMQAHLRAYRAPAGRTNVQFSAIMGGGSSTNTALASWNTTVSGVDLAPLDHIMLFAGTPSDLSTINSIGITQTGITFSSFSNSPGSAVTANGNDQSSGAVAGQVTGGTATGTATISVGLSTARKGIAGLLRVRFTAEVLSSGPEPGRMLLAMSM